VVSYDKNGNLLTDNLNTYTWDPNWGKMLSVNTGSVVVNATYDAFGRVVEQYNGAAYTEILYSPVGKIALMNGSNLTKAFAPLPGGGAAIYNSTGLAYYRHADWLGSSHLTSTAAQGLYSSQVYAPFGEAYATAGASGTTSSAVDPNFTGQNSDTVPSLYDFTFREHSMSQGRWISPDPLGVGAVDPTNPQTWNRYAYVVNSPLALTDPLGLTILCALHTLVGAVDGVVVSTDVWWECVDSGGGPGGGGPGGGGPGGGGGGGTAANNGPNPRLLNIAQQIQNCPSFSNVGNQIAQGVNSGSISVGNVPSNAVGTTNGYFNPTSVIAPDALDDPSTVIHEWIHQTQAAGNPFFIFLKGANQIQSLFTSDSQGFLDYSAQNVANKIVSVCGVK
jgi:RHS repeat-associated protein